MKAGYLSLAVLITTLFCSCTGNHYTVEIDYQRTNAGGDSAITKKSESFNATNDSSAFIKAMAQFKTAKSQQPDETKGVPVKFIVRNSKGNVVTPPGEYKDQQIEENLYPNQKPKTP